ncbi:MAG: flavodoxin family protein [Promethearchaeota archaeon]
MKVVIIYDTKTGKTKSFADKIAEKLKQKNHDIQIVRDKQLKDLKIVKDADLIAIGTPVHMGSAAFTLRRKLKKLSKIDLNGKKLITFSSSKFKDEWKKACKYIKNKLASTNISFIGEFGSAEKENTSIQNIEEQIEKILQNL